ncbi:uncharacterized protein C1orf131 [Centruroides vittatus]|uniref:uncharacterized protein C1orf131 n=1 Tax=Centruroides vittatus TaxID=120091 RepID=UPI00350F3F46
MENIINKENSKRKKKVEVVVFDSRPKKKQDIKEETVNPDVSEDPKSLIDIEKARYEVYRFGISGFDKEKAENAREALAIRLGAKPPKRKYKNYKEILEENKKQKLEETEQNKRNQKVGFGSKQNKKSRRKNKKGIKNFNCQIGKYKDGIQFISKYDIAKIKK